eukprot:115856_1
MTSTHKRTCCATCSKENATSQCSRCKSVRYCNTECQQIGWKRHKKVCKLFKSPNTIHEMTQLITPIPSHMTKLIPEIPAGAKASIITTGNRKELEYMEWLTHHPEHDPDRAEFTSAQNTDFILTWSEYAHHASKGKISSHFHALSDIKNNKLSKYSQCIHNKFNCIQQCIDKLDNVLYGSPMYFREFASDWILCTDCLLTICNKQYICKLFAAIYQQCIKLFQLTMIDPTTFVTYKVKEWTYVACCLLRYINIIKLVLHTDEFYMKIFLSFTYYLQHFSKLKRFIKIMDGSFNITDHGYAIFTIGIEILYLFEYNFVGILTCMRQIAPYFKLKHLTVLVELNCFSIFQKFINEYFNLEYMRIITDSIKLTDQMQIRASMVLCLSLCVIQLINCKVFKQYKLITDVSMKRKFKKTILEIRNVDKNMATMLRMYRTITPMFYQQQDRFYLKDDCKYSFYKYFLKMSTGFITLSHKTALQKKRKQVRNHKFCGNEKCRNGNCIKKLRLCGQCRFVYYCSKKCQKKHWCHHRAMCKNFAL